MELIKRTTHIPNQPCIALEYDRLDECLAEMKLQGITYIVLNSAWGWKDGASLDFLKDNTWIKGFWIVHPDNETDLSPVNYLSGLEYFVSPDVRLLTGHIDFKNLKELKFISYTWSDKLFTNMHFLWQLREAHLFNYPFKNIEYLQFAPDMEKLEIYYSRKLKSLAGLHNFKSLWRLLVSSAPDLEDINSLHFVSSSLRKLSFELIKKVKDFSVLEDLVHLESFYIAKSGPIHSIQWMRKLKNLKLAQVYTEVLDGDITYLKEKGFKYKKLKKDEE